MGAILDTAIGHGARRDVDDHLVGWIVLDGRHQARHVRFARGDAGHAERDAIAEEDVGERLADQPLYAPAQQRLRGVFARRPAAEVLVHDRDAWPLGLEARVVEDVSLRVALGVEALVIERRVAEAVEGHGLQVARRDDAVGIDVVATQRDRPAADLLDLHQRAHRSPSISRTSLTAPSSAAAATMAGLISKVRPDGLPCRPLKLRLLEEAQTCRPTNLSGFIARHIEHPGSRHSNPAARNTSSSPSASAWRATSCEPGTTIAFTCAFTLPSLATRAASRRSERRPLVHEPMNATSTFVPAIGTPGFQSMY